MMFKKADKITLWLLIILNVLGFLIIYSASSPTGLQKYNDSFYYLKRDAVYFLIGLIVFFLGYTLKPLVLKKLSFIVFLLTLFLTLATLMPHFGVSLGGAQRWLGIGSFTIQPSEFLKIGFLLFLAAWFSSKKNINSNKVFGFFIFLLILLAAIFIKQPSTSSLIIFTCLGFILYLASGVSWGKILPLILVCVLILLVLVAASPYRFKRVLTFLNPTGDSQGASYQVNQAKLAIGSGGIFGKGYGHSEAKFSYLPETFSDSIFAIWAEETGFIGAAFLILLYSALVFRLTKLAWQSQEHFSKLYLVGFASLIALQSLLNIGAISGALPLTGVPLPFISYGGSSLIALLAGAGIALNLSKNT